MSASAAPGVPPPAPGAQPVRSRHALLLAAGALAAATALLAMPLARGIPLVQFTLDDAYITFRYSENLAQGLGPVWNAAGDPVEGYTSFLWMGLVAGALEVGLSAETAGKLLGAAAGAGLALLFALYGGRRIGPLPRLVALAALALSPAFLVVALQGLETPLAALLAAAGAALCVESIRRRRALPIAGFFATALLGLLARPDLAPFWAVTGIGLVAGLAWDRDWRALRTAAVAVVGLLLVPGGAYFAWRWSFFGYPFPNTFYVKSAADLLRGQGPRLLAEFLVRIAGPYLLVVLLLFGRRLLLHARGAGARAAAEGERRELYAIGVLLAGVGAFLATSFVFAPLQGQLYRFQMPALPVILLAMMLLLGREWLGLPGRWAASRSLATAAAAVVAIAVLFPLNTLAQASFEVSARWQYDRVLAGQALAPLADGRRSMLVTESGAVPFFSGWRASDLLGLNDETIAHQGLSARHLESLAPDLVMVVFNPNRALARKRRRLPPSYALLFDLLRRRGYRLADAIVKTDARLRPASTGVTHLYFVRPDESMDEAVRALRSMRRVSRLDPAVVEAFLRRYELAPPARDSAVPSSPSR